MGQQPQRIYDRLWKSLCLQISKAHICILYDIMQECGTGLLFRLHLLCKMKGMKNIRGLPLIILGAMGIKTDPDCFFRKFCVKHCVSFLSEFCILLKIFCKIYSLCSCP